MKRSLSEAKNQIDNSGPKNYLKVFSCASAGVVAETPLKIRRMPVRLSAGRGSGPRVFTGPENSTAQSDPSPATGGPLRGMNDIHLLARRDASGSLRRTEGSPGPWKGLTGTKLTASCTGANSGLDKNHTGNVNFHR